MLTRVLETKEMQTKERLKRIASNLVYLLARYLSAAGLGKSKFWQLIVERFLDGWNDGCDQAYMRMSEYDMVMADV